MRHNIIPCPGSPSVYSMYTYGSSNRDYIQIDAHIGSQKLGSWLLPFLTSFSKQGMANIKKELYCFKLSNCYVLELRQSMVSKKHVFVI
jgi:hypothetical protein